MKNCPLCDITQTTELGKNLHDRFDFHTTALVTWKPEKGHDLKAFHDKCIEVTKYIVKLENKISIFNSLPFYKRIFKKI